MNFNESVQYIHSLLQFGIKPGLERISMLLEMLDNPQNKIKAIHIAGTNGKGSTSTMVSNMLIQEGYKTGLFTSPYVIDFCERIQINGENVSKSLFSECVTTVREKIEQLNNNGIVITEFEAITVTAFLCFLRSGCEYVVLEVGLGGRFDATNVIKNPLAVIITSISLDHTQILGDTIGKIAFEKCGIIKDGTTVITSHNQKREALSVICDTCKTSKSELIITTPKGIEILDDSISGTVFTYNKCVYKTRLTGAHQLENIVNAIECARALGLSENAVACGIEATKMLARMEVIGENPIIIRDGGHNEGCASALRDFLIKYNVKDIHMLIGLMADKDVEGYVSKIAPLCKSVITVTPSNSRALDCDALEEIVKKYCENTMAISNPQKAYKHIISSTNEAEAILICGSFYLMSDIFKE